MSTDETKDTNDKQTTATQNTEISEYKRKKNWVSGVDNDTITLGVAGVALTIAGALAFPHVKEWLGNITNKQAPPPPPPPVVNEEPYIPPTEPLPAPQPQQPQQPEPQQQEQQQQKEEEDIPDTFYDDEMRKRRQMITGKGRLRYDSQFGAGIANS